MAATNSPGGPLRGGTIYSMTDVVCSPDLNVCVFAGPYAALAQVRNKGMVEVLQFKARHGLK